MLQTMAINNDINIRADLTDISNTIMHLYELSKYFEKMRREFSSLWHDNDGDLRAYLSKIDDWELFHLMEEFYRIGKDASYSLSLELPLINNEKRYPVISEYIDMIEKSVASCKREIIELLNESEKLFLKKEGKLGHWKIDRLVEIHKEMLSNLNALKNEFKNIKNSERYRIENNLKVDKLEPKKKYEIETTKHHKIRIINEKMLYKIYLITAIVLAIVLIIYYTTPWIKNLITYYKETKGDVITTEIIESTKKIEEGVDSLRIKDKETISLKPRILVFVPEMHAGKEISDNSTEIAIINGLLKAGFLVVNKHERDDISQNPLIKRVLKEDKQATLELAMDYEANVVIAGKAISEKTGMISDFHSVRAYLEIRVYKTDEDKVIAAHSLQISGAGITEDSACKVAFNLAGEQMADYLVEKLAEFRNPEEIRNIKLFIDNFKNKSQFEKLKEAISKMLLVIEVKVNLLENEKAELIVKTLGDIQELYEDLSNLTFINLEIKKANDNLLQITVR